MTQKTILITGATDGIGLETAKALAADGHDLLVHGRSAAKLEATVEALNAIAGHGPITPLRADLSDLGQVDELAEAVLAARPKLDALVNNAGVFRTSTPRLEDGTDVRFMVNLFAPYRLTQRLLPRLGSGGRIVNLSSAAQASVDFEALAGRVALGDSDAYAQSKLAITMWSAHLARQVGPDGPLVVAVNPASFLGSKMVKEAYGVPGKDLRVGADILVRAVLSDEFAGAHGRYFDNDQGRFAAPHPDATDPSLNARLDAAIEVALAARA